MLGPQVAWRNARDLLSLSANKVSTTLRSGANSASMEFVRSVRLFTPINYAHNARVETALYDQRWMSETPFSMTKRSLGFRRVIAGMVSRILGGRSIVRPFVFS